MKTDEKFIKFAIEEANSQRKQEELLSGLFLLKMVKLFLLVGV